MPVIEIAAALLGGVLGSGVVELFKNKITQPYSRRCKKCSFSIRGNDRSIVNRVAEAHEENFHS